MNTKHFALTSACFLLLAVPANATTVDEFCDLDPHHWAYTAVKALVEKYHVMEGYPGGCPEVQQQKVQLAPRRAPAAKKPVGRKLAQAPAVAPSPAAEICAAPREHAAP